MVFPFNFLHLGSSDKEKPLPELPQNSKDLESREKGLEEARKLYEWTYENMPRGSPYVAKLPEKEEPSLTWKLKIAATTVQISIGSQIATFGIDDVVEAVSSHEKGSAFVRELRQKLRGQDIMDTRATSIDDFKELFHFPVKDAKSMVDYASDLAFARLRLQGPHPNIITPCTAEVRRLFKALDSSDFTYAALKRQVDTAMAEGRLYAADLSEMGKLSAGSYPMPDGTTIPKYISSAVALFEVVQDESRRALLAIDPLCIQCEVAQEEKDVPPIFTPEDGWAWEIAKACYQSADGAFHEVVAHLGRTHLTLEPFAVAMRRTLSVDHPIAVLLEPHFEGLNSVNSKVPGILFSDNGGFDTLLSSVWVELEKMCGEKVLEQLQKDFSFPALLKERKMTKEDFPYLYPYRDDALALWGGIETWVREYLEIYYGTTSEEQSANIEGDYELKNYMDEMVTAGKSGWMKEFATSTDKFAFIVKVITTVIHTGSVEHAAVNFPQAPIMSFVPAYPMAIMQPMPKKKTGYTENDYLSYLPPIEVAKSTVLLGGVLGGVFYTTLGEYDGGNFLDTRVQAPLKKFQAFLEDHEADAEGRNALLVASWKAKGLERKEANNFAYKTLLPRDIPQSTNI